MSGERDLEVERLREVERGERVLFFILKIFSYLT